VKLTKGKDESLNKFFEDLLSSSDDDDDKIEPVSLDKHSTVIQNSDNEEKKKV
jgi:hypothetical protein